MKRPDIDGIDPEIQNYIWFLENTLNGPSELQKELSFMCHVLAEDLRLVNSGATKGFLLLSGNKDDKIFERILTLVKNQSDFKSLTLVELENPENKKPDKKKMNIQDFVIKPK